MCLYHSVRGKYPLVQGKSRSALSSTSSWDDYTHGKRGFRLPPMLIHTLSHTQMSVHTQTCTKAVPIFRKKYQAAQETLKVSFFVNTNGEKPPSQPLSVLSLFFLSASFSFLYVSPVTSVDIVRQYVVLPSTLVPLLSLLQFLSKSPLFINFLFLSVLLFFIHLCFPRGTGTAPVWKSVGSSRAGWT